MTDKEKVEKIIANEVLDGDYDRLFMSYQRGIDEATTAIQELMERDSCVFSEWCRQNCFGGKDGGPYFFFKEFEYLKDKRDCKPYSISELYKEFKLQQ